MYKIGQKTNRMYARYYILRDGALFIYKNIDQKFPSNVIPLRGFYIVPLLEDKNSNFYGFIMYHENKAFKRRRLYHTNKDACFNWIEVLKEQASN